MRKLICLLFGHRWELLRHRLGMKRPEFRVIDGRPVEICSKANIYNHWRCEICGLTHCRKRFYRYTDTDETTKKRGLESRGETND